MLSSGFCCGSVQSNRVPGIARNQGNISLAGIQRNLLAVSVIVLRDSALTGLRPGNRDRLSVRAVIAGLYFCNAVVNQIPVLVILRKGAVLNQYILKGNGLIISAILTNRTEFVIIIGIRIRIVFQL